MLIAALALFSPPLSTLSIHLHRHGCLGLNDALLCGLCLSTMHATPLSEQKEVLFLLFSVLLLLFPQKGRDRMVLSLPSC